MDKVRNAVANSLQLCIVMNHCNQLWVVVVSFDAKINFDDNAAFRQKAIFDQRDTAEEVE